MPLVNPNAATGNGTTLGFFTTTPVAKVTGFVNTYATADKTLGAYTANDQSAPFTGVPALLVNAAAVADLLTLQVAYENLRIFVEDLAQQYNSLIVALKAYGEIA